MACKMQQNIGYFFILAFIMIASSSSVKAATLRTEKSVVKRATQGNDEALTVIEGSTTELKCTADGTSSPTIYWLFNGELVKQSSLAASALPSLSIPSGNSNHQTNYVTVSTIMIRDASSSDAGLYTCVKDFPGMRENKTYTISVTPSEEPSVMSEPAGAADVRIYMYTDSVFEFENVTLVLVCRATQGPSSSAPTISWLYNDSPITSADSNFQVQANGDLEILKTDEAVHWGVLRCLATGDNGSTAEVSPFVYLFEPQMGL